MTLAEMRTLFTEITGRYDLSEERIHLYLNAGIRKLNRVIEGEQFIKESSETLTDYYIDIEDAMNILDVYLVETTGRNKLYKVVFRSFIKYFPDFETATGTPTVWTNGSRTANGRGKRILFNSNPTSAEIIVRYKEDNIFDLLDDNSETWWSINYPEALIFASAFVLESFYRNSEGMRDWLVALQSVLDDVEFEFMSVGFQEDMQISEFGV